MKLRSLISLLVWVWGIFLLLIILVLINILFILPQKRYDPIVKWMARNFLRLIGIRVRVHFDEPVNPKGTYLFICNHVNIFDPIILYAHIPGIVRGVELGSHFRWPVYGWTLRRMGHIPIDRDNAGKARTSLNKAADKLRKGQSIVILPEGHRTPDGELGPFMRGAFVLAKEAGRDIVPAALRGAWKITHKGTWLISPGTVDLRFGTIFPERKWREMTTGDLRDVSRDEISRLLHV